MTALVKRFTRNTAGRDLVVGDIHGHFSRLQAALDAIGFDPSRDRLFSVGDLVDRGPESRQALEWIERPWFHAVSGNHEDFAIRWPKGHMRFCDYVQNGGAWNAAASRDEQERAAEAFAALPVVIDVETEHGLIGIVHADCPMPAWSDLVSQLEDPNLSSTRLNAILGVAQWSRSRIEAGDTSGVDGVRAVIVGHTRLERPLILGNVFYIDTGAWYDPAQEFCILDLATLAVATAPIDS